LFKDEGPFLPEKVTEKFCKIGDTSGSPVQEGAQRMAQRLRAFGEGKKKQGKKKRKKKTTVGGRKWGGNAALPANK